MAVRTLVFLSACALPLSAQSLRVLPESHRQQEGTSSTNVPFGRSTGARVQCLYDPMLFAGAGTITSLALRLDGGTTAAAKQVDCEIRMSTAALPLLLLSPDFQSNRGVDETVVLPRQLLTLPAQAAPSTPSPFLPPLPLAVPFHYDPAAGPLLVEFVVFAQPPGAYTLDTTYVCDSPEYGIGPAGCPQAGASPLRVESATTQVIWGRPWIARVLDAPAGAMVTLGLGTQETGNWNGWTLPYDLAPLGAAGCYVSIDLVGSFFGVAAGDGTAQFPFAIPSLPSAVGAWIRFQAGALNLQANALGIVTSQARKVAVCGWEPVGRVWSSGTTATLGTREIGVAPVLQVAIQ